MKKYIKDEIFNVTFEMNANADKRKRKEWVGELRLKNLKNTIQIFKSKFLNGMTRQI